ncbi:MAG: amidohydrolase [Bacteroidales bacterium]|nr:amidohydrolase [Bacteroidales bacterium]
MNLANEPSNKIIAFRKFLHKYPELSKKEFKTVKQIKAFLLDFQPDEIIEGIGKTGLAAVYKSKNPGKTVLIRGDIDALPIFETNTFEHASVFPGIAHKCGHDGHTAVLGGVAGILHDQPIKSGKVVLLFQPAEETGEGAKQILADERFQDIKPDFVFALHNLPGFSSNTVVISKNYFAAASKGMIIKLFGKTSHAANPEHGISPALAVAEIIQKFSALSMDRENFKDFKLITLIHSRIGEIAFGTSPGYAEVMATLRSFRNDDMYMLTRKSISLIENICNKYGLSEKIEFREEFPATRNNDFCVDIVKNVAVKNHFKVAELKVPFRWSEDFGYFTEKYSGAFFGIGAGKNHPALHNPDYDFPDEILPTGITMFNGIIRKILE